MTRHNAMTERGRPRSWAVALGLVLLAVGVAVWWVQTRPAGVPPSTGAGPSQVASPQQRLPQPELAPRRPGAPDRVVIPALDVDSRVLAVRAPGGVLIPPPDPQLLGWWADGARPGDRRGSALVTGHTVSTGGGALDDLEELSRGDAVRVVSGRTTTAYDVSSIATYSRGDLARRAEELFDQSVRGRLVLITCEDWNGEAYLSNVVVTALPTGDAA
ncbi:MAG TPA: class F sortase [Nocardioides sp.]|nr:class F sortase [Nocardioides sp.]